MENLGERITKIREQNSISQSAMARKLDVSRSALYRYEVGERVPDMSFLSKFAAYFKISLDDLVYGAKDIAEAETSLYSDNEETLIGNYRVLQEPSQKVIYNLTETWAAYEKSKEKLEKPKKQKEKALPEKAEPIYVNFNVSEQPAAAGYGTYLGPEQFRQVRVKADKLPANAVFGVPVSGDSMEPDYEDQDILVVSRDEISKGDVGVFTLEGEGYVKILGDDVLISLNRKYDNIPYTKDIICNGKVVGVLKPKDVEK